ncbi:GDSL-type esterase/lipase family protein [Bacillus sp. FJAT-27445]|uniref:GDSL-type esterase/lipase family protein n=1 Tax=Bacillus sp. FJAT-27445 TaxID=1679166 RepID=UPI00074390F4|nr:GDSL-type esterase/lipase family protein [Bacillus sp. FJAT-27445]
MSKGKRALQYTALGDSLTVGIGTALFPCSSFVWRYKALSEHALNRQIDVNIFAKTGATSREILQFFSWPKVAVNVASADIITITVGGNDLIDAAEVFLATFDTQVLKKALDESTANIGKILEEIHTLKSGVDNSYIIRLVNLYNPFPKIPEADRWIQDFNAHLETISKKPHIGVVDVYHAFSGRQNELLSLDRAHPNPNGYRVMAEVAYQLGYDHL